MPTWALPFLATLLLSGSVALGGALAVTAQGDPIAGASPTTILAGFLSMSGIAFGALIWGYKRSLDHQDRLLRRNAQLVNIIAKYLPAAISEAERTDPETEGAA